jgi:hypothetical protein
MGPWNDFMGTWNYFLGSMEKFHWAIGYHFAQYYTSRISSFMESFLGVVARASEQGSRSSTCKSLQGDFVSQLFIMISTLFP